MRTEASNKVTLRYLYLPRRSGALLLHVTRRHYCPAHRFCLLVGTNLIPNESFRSIRHLSQRKTFYCHRRRPANSMSRPELTRSIVGASFLLPVINGAMHIPPAVSATRVTLEDNQPLDTPILVLLFALHVLIDGKSISPSNTVQNRS